jgi:hypothetical protein
VVANDFDDLVEERRAFTAPSVADLVLDAWTVRRMAGEQDPLEPLDSRLVAELAYLKEFLQADLRACLRMSHVVGVAA